MHVGTTQIFLPNLQAQSSLSISNSTVFEYMSKYNPIHLPQHLAFSGFKPLHPQPHYHSKKCNLFIPATASVLHPRPPPRKYNKSQDMRIKKKKKKKGKRKRPRELLKQNRKKGPLLLLDSTRLDRPRWRSLSNFGKSLASQNSSAQQVLFWFRFSDLGFQKTHVSTLVMRLLHFFKKNFPLFPLLDHPIHIIKKWRVMFFFDDDFLFFGMSHDRIR